MKVFLGPLGSALPVWTGQSYPSCEAQSEGSGDGPVDKVRGKALVRQTHMKLDAEASSGMPERLVPEGVQPRRSPGSPLKKQRLYRLASLAHAEANIEAAGGKKVVH